MEIRKELPFECCENCGEFILDVGEETTHLYGDGKEIGSRLVLYVRCKNARKCIHLNRNLYRLVDQYDTDT